MKKIIITLATLLVAAGVSFGQSLKEATEAAQAAQAAFEAGNAADALQGFRSALTIAEGLGEEGQSLAEQCKTAIPQIVLSQAKKAANASEFDAALEKLAEVVVICEKFGAGEAIAAEAKGLVPDILLSKGIDCYNNKDFPGAIAAFKKVIEAEPENGKAYFSYGQVLAQTGNYDDAIAAFTKCIELGYETSKAETQILTANLKKSQASYKAGQLTEAVDGAISCISSANANASIKNNAAAIIQGCAQTAALKNKKPAEAVAYYTKLEEADPANAKLPMISYLIGAGYYQAQNNAQAKVWLNKAMKDPTAAAKAKPILDAIK